MEMDAILQLIDTDEKTREAIETQYAKRTQLKQAVEDEKKKISDDLWAEVRSKVEETKKELNAKVEEDQKENQSMYEKNVKRLTDMYNANKEAWKKDLVSRIISVE
jgi:rubrerythrin